MKSQHKHMVIITKVNVTCRAVVCGYTPRERRISLSKLETEQIFLIITVIIKKKKSVQRPTCFHINYAGNRLIDASVSMNSREREREREKTLLAEDVLFIVQQAAFRKSNCSP